MIEANPIESAIASGGISVVLEQEISKGRIIKLNTFASSAEEFGQKLNAIFDAGDKRSSRYKAEEIREELRRFLLGHEDRKRVKREMEAKYSDREGRALTPVQQVELSNKDYEIERGENEIARLEALIKAHEAIANG